MFLWQILHCKGSQFKICCLKILVIYLILIHVTTKTRTLCRWYWSRYDKWLLHRLTIVSFRDTLSWMIWKLVTFNLISSKAMFFSIRNLNDALLCMTWERINQVHSNFSPCTLWWRHGMKKISVHLMRSIWLLFFVVYLNKLQSTKLPLIFRRHDVHVTSLDTVNFGFMPYFVVKTTTYEY